MAHKHLIFVGGLHRSGTTLLHEIIGSHPQISAFSKTGVSKDEGQHLQKVYLPASTFGGPGRFGFDPRSFMDEHHVLATDYNAAKLMRDWSRYWDMSREFLLEKSPPNLVKTRFLQRLFPGCRFVILLRHPIAVAYATLKWSRTDIPTLIEHSLRCYERFILDLPFLEHVFVLRYEDLVRRPQQHVDAIFRWIGIDSAPIDAVVNTDINAAYFSRWRADLKTKPEASSPKWSGLLAAREEYEKRFRAIGYSMAELDSHLPVAWLGPQQRVGG